MPETAETRKQVNQGVAWFGLASTAIGVLEFISIVICLKFFLTKAEYGTWGVVGPLFIALELAAELGLTAAIIQRKSSEAQLSTVFWINVLVALGLYGLVAVAAVGLAALQGIPVLAPLMWVLGLNMLLRTLYQLPYALMMRSMRIGEVSAIRVIANVFEVGVRVGFAAAGFGVWCFVAGALSRTVVATVGVQLRCPWWPKLIWQPHAAADYVKFGLRSSGHKVLFHLYTNLDYQIVAFFFGPAANGVYQAAYVLVLEPIRHLSNIVVTVGFAAFSRLKHDRAAIAAQFIAFTRQNFVVMGLILVVILLAAEELLIVIFKPEFVVGSTAARLLAFVGVLRALSYVAQPLLDGLGHPEKTLRYQAVATIVMPALFLLSALTLGRSMGAMSVAVAWAVGYPVAFWFIMAMALDEIQMTVREYLRGVVGIALCLAASLAVGVVAREMTATSPPLVRLAVIVAVVVLTAGVLLARFQGISPASVWRSTKSRRA